MKFSTSFVLAAAPFIVEAYPGFAHDIVAARHVGEKRAPTTKVNSTLHPKHFQFKPVAVGEFRGPCPIMNTLANHDFVPHNGLNVTRAPFILGCQQGLGLSYEFAEQIFDTALDQLRAGNPDLTPHLNTTDSFDIWMLHNTHGEVEHDGSLARKDIFFDPSNQFDPATFDNLVSYFGDSKTVDIPILANARARHALDMCAYSKGFEITAPSIPVIVGENAMLLGIFGKGNSSSPVINRAVLEHFFRKEQFPVQLGWVPNVDVGADIGTIVQAMIAQSPAGVPLTFDPKGNSTCGTKTTLE